MFNNIREGLRNMIGWSTKRHIVVFESDDWGSVRTRSLKDREEMFSRGLDVASSIFPKYDCLESNDDLERLFELLTRHKDSTGRNPVFTPMCVVANPDFEKIEAADFGEYYYEPFSETCKRYSNHDRVLALWKEGIEKRLFVPALHGREHLNVYRWMKNLKDGNEGIKIAFDHQSTGVSKFNGQIIPEYLGAFHPDYAKDIFALKEIVWDAGRLFKNQLGYSPTHFIAPNRESAKALDGSFAQIGVKYMTMAKVRHYPLGDDRYKTEYLWLGKRDKKNNITYITRNGGFEQVNPGRDWVDECMHDIQMAFQYHKPCVISSHRVNYVGGIEESNATLGLKKLDELLIKILKTWADVEFMTSTELGDLITSTRK